MVGAGSASVRIVGLEVLSVVLLLLCLLWLSGVCLCFFSLFSIFSPLCSCVGQALLGRIKFVSIIASFLMKNMLRHGREKNKGINNI